MKKLILGALVLGGLVGLSLPIANLILDHPTDANQQKISAIQEPYFRKAAPILTAKCAHCHISGTPVPFYANFPIASTLIKRDIEDGLARLDFIDKLQGAGEQFSEIELARMERVLHEGSMPPLRFVALHWKSALGQSDKETLLAWIQHRRISMRHDSTVTKANSGEPIYPIPLKVELNTDKVTLGNRLFHDTRLSRDNSISCASCHDLNKGGTDHSKVSTGIRGQHGGINAPTVYNSAYNFVQFWDGRAKDLKEQARGPVHNPVEMGSNWPQVIGKLNQDPYYLAAFQRHYPNGITGDNIVDAIVEFEKSLITPNARFDRYLRGDHTALSKAEVTGYQLFKAHCVSCHAGTNVGGLSYEKMGWRRPYFDETKTHKDDFGRFNVTELEKDRHYFKVPTLRNISVTWPYFHNGSTSDLREAVKVMATHQVNEKLSARDIDQITAFLKTLTGEYDGKPL